MVWANCARWVGCTWFEAGWLAAQRPHVAGAAGCLALEILATLKTYKRPVRVALPKMARVRNPSGRLHIVPASAALPEKRSHFRLFAGRNLARRDAANTSCRCRLAYRHAGAACCLGRHTLASGSVIEHHLIILILRRSVNKRETIFQRQSFSSPDNVVRQALKGGQLLLASDRSSRAAPFCISGAKAILVAGLCATRNTARTFGMLAKRLQQVAPGGYQRGRGGRAAGPGQVAIPHIPPARPVPPGINLSVR